MAPSVTAVSLKKLMLGGKVHVLHRETEEEVGKVVFESMPSAILLHFAPAFSNSMTVTGGSKNTLKLILKWTISCCQGKGIAEFNPLKTFSFIECVQAFEMAQIIGDGSEYMGALKKEMMARCYDIALQRIVSVEDVKAVYKSLVHNAPIRRVIIQNVGKAFANGVLHYEEVYLAFEEENESYWRDMAEYHQLRMDKDEEASKRFDRNMLSGSKSKKGKMKRRPGTFDADETRKAKKVKTMTVQRRVNRKGQWKLTREDYITLGIETHSRGYDHGYRPISPSPPQGRNTLVSDAGRESTSRTGEKAQQESSKPACSQGQHFGEDDSE